MSSGRGSPSIASVDIAPQTSPSTTIGAPAQELIPVVRAASAIVPATSAKSSIRAGRPVSRTLAQIVGPSSGQRLSTANGCGRSPQAPMTVAVPSGSNRHTATSGRPMTWPTSLAMASNTSADAAPPATSSATRRSEACWAAEDRAVLAQHALGVQAVLDVVEGHDHAAPVLQIERDRDVGDGDHRAVAADEPVELVRDPLAGGERTQQRALRGGERPAVLVPVVDRRVTVAAGQLVQVLVAERGERSRVGEPDRAVGVDDADRLLGRLEHGGEEALGADPQAGEIDQGLGHPGSGRQSTAPFDLRAARCRASSVRSRGGV